GDDVGATAAAGALARIVQVDPLQCGGETIAVALAADLAIGDDVDIGALHVADGQHGGIVLSLLEEWLGDAPDIAGTNTWRQSAEQLVSIDEPVWLRVAADNSGRQELDRPLSHSRLLPRPERRRAGLRSG